MVFCALVKATFLRIAGFSDIFIANDIEAAAGGDGTEFVVTDTDITLTSGVQFPAMGSMMPGDFVIAMASVPVSAGATSGFRVESTNSNQMQSGVMLT